MMKNLLRKITHNDTTTFLTRIALLYVVLMLCRIAFYAVNFDSLGAITPSELFTLIHGSLVFDSISILYVNAPFVIFSLLPLRFRAKKWYQNVLFWLFTVINALVIVVNQCDAVYFHYAKKRFTVEEFHFTDNDNTATVMWKALAENWVMVLVTLLIIWVMVWTYRRIKDHPTELKHWWSYYPVNTLILILVLVASIGLIRGGFSRSIRPLTLSNASQYATTPQKSSMILSNPFCIIRTLGNKPFEYVEFFDKPTLDSLYTPYHYPQNLTHTIGQRNIVIFTLESFSREHSTLLNPDLYDSTEHYMPFLDSLMTNSYTFTDAYASGRKSIDALPSVLAAIPSYQTPFVLLPQSIGEKRGLPGSLAEIGYTTAFFCGSPRSSMGFVAFANSVGVQNFYTREDYEKECGMADFDNFWGIWDEPFMGYMGRKLSQLKQPFFANIFTLSSHHPFVVPEKYKNTLPKGHTKVHQPVAYTDQSIRRFFDYARTQPWYENTIFVFVGDHVSSEVYADKTRTSTGNTSIIMFAYTPDHAIKGYDNQVAQQSDLMPTLLGLVGYDKPYFAFGTDVFNEPHRPRFAVNYGEGVFQIITDSLAMFYNMDQRKTNFVYSRSDTMQKNNIVEPQSPYQQEKERLLKAVIQSYGEKVSQRNYLPKLDPIR